MSCNLLLFVGHNILCVCGAFVIWRATIEIMCLPSCDARVAHLSCVYGPANTYTSSALRSVYANNRRAYRMCVCGREWGMLPLHSRIQRRRCSSRTIQIGWMETLVNGGSDRKPFRVVHRRTAAVHAIRSINIHKHAHMHK